VVQVVIKTESTKQVSNLSVINDGFGG